MAQPAERIRAVPTTKMTTSIRSGLPLEAIHSANRVGHSNRRMPIGLSARISRKYNASLFMGESLLELSSYKTAILLVLAGRRALGLGNLERQHLDTGQI